MVRILCLLPELNAGQKAGSEAWSALEDALRPLIAAGRLALERLTPCTQNALEKRLQLENIDIVHFFGPLVFRGEAHYATITLESSDRRPRQLNIKTLAKLVPACVQLVALQAAECAAMDPAELTAALVEDNRLGFLVTTTLSCTAQRLFIAKFYSGLVTGQTVEEAITDTAEALATSGFSSGKVLSVGNSDIAFKKSAPSPTIDTSREFEMLSTKANVNAVAEASWQAVMRTALDRKRLTDEFDVFLCHHSVDKPTVKVIAERLLTRGIIPWLDVWELQPGIPWMKTLQERLKTIKSGAVFVGTSGQGPWQEVEVEVLLEQLVMRRCPVIPVLLPDAPEQPDLPPFLARNTWVDFRITDPDPLEQLVWGVSGKRPSQPF